MNHDRDHVLDIRNKIRAIVEDHGAELVAEYYSPTKISWPTLRREESPFAGELFDGFGDNNPEKFTGDDLVAASLLDVRFGPVAVSRLVIGGEANELLLDESLPTDVPLWGEVDVAKGSPAWRLWDLLTGIPDVGPTRASKLLARKRPHLLPILDSVIKEHLDLKSGDSWALLKQVLADEEIRLQLDSLAPANVSARPSTLRLLDVVTWMRFSESGNARDVREGLGMEVPERPPRHHAAD